MNAKLLNSISLPLVFLPWKKTFLKKKKPISWVSLSGWQWISKQEGHKSAITQEKENKVCRPNPSRSEKLSHSHLKSQNSWGEAMKMFCRKAYCTFVLHLMERFVLYIAAKGEGREDTVLLVQGFWCSSTCLSFKTKRNLHTAVPDRQTCYGGKSHQENYLGLGSYLHSLKKIFSRLTF